MANNNFDFEMDLFTMFGVDVGEIEKKRVPPTTPLSETDTVISTFESEDVEKEKKEVKKKDKLSNSVELALAPYLKFTRDTIICYSKETIPMATMFSLDALDMHTTVLEAITTQLKEVDSSKQDSLVKELLKKHKESLISESLIVKKLSKEYLELLPTLTSLYFESKRNIIVPVLKAKKKGVKLLPEGKKIGYEVIHDFITISKVFARYSLEVHGDIYYNFERSEYFLDIPQQVVSSVFCKVTEELGCLALKVIGSKKVGEIHSHHTMAPFPSATDNQHERNCLIYIIVGSMGDFFPRITARTFDTEYEKHISLKLENIVESPYTHTYDKYDLSKVLREGRE